MSDCCNNSGDGGLCDTNAPCANTSPCTSCNGGNCCCHNNNTIYRPMFNTRDTDVSCSCACAIITIVIIMILMICKLKSEMKTRLDS